MATSKLGKVTFGLSMSNQQPTNNVMKNSLRYFDTGSLIVIFFTFILFAAALYSTGFTHDLLLEAGVFLVSVKLIVMSYKNSVASENLLRELSEIRSLLERLTDKAEPPEGRC